MALGSVFITGQVANDFDQCHALMVGKLPCGTMTLFKGRSFHVLISFRLTAQVNLTAKLYMW